MKYISLKWFGYILVSVIACVFCIAYLTLPSMPDTRAYIAKATKYDVEVMRDGLGIPHIYGNRDIDTAFGLGYVQSEDDFETLQSVLLATRGTLAAEIGYQATETDFVVQFMGVWDAVNANYERQVPEKIKQIAQAYADGVNLYAAQNPQHVSRYFLPATGKDIIAGFTFKMPMFYGFDQILSDLVNLAVPPEVAKSQNALIWQPTNALPIGSQGIAVAPHRSEDGLTHLLINSHQPLSGPVAWYEARLHSEEGWNMVGSTFPGAPVIIHGHNDHLGWANTVNKPDLVDIYQLTINPDNENQYLLDGQWKTFKTKVAKMTIKLFGPLRWTVKKEINISEHGPVMATKRGSFALRWSGMNEVGTLEFMFAANKATNKEQFEAALKLNSMPSINFVYADKAGNIAHYYNAKFPKRIDGWQWDRILPGDRSDLIWTEFHDFSAMPKTVNPSSGLVYNANNTPWLATDGDDDAQESQYPESMGIETFVTNRALQIEEKLKGVKKISKGLFKEVKYDLFYHPNSYQITVFHKWLAQQQSVDLSQIELGALDALRSWNLSTHQDNHEAALAVLTMAPIQKANGKPVEMHKITQAFKKAVAVLVKYHGSYTPPYGDVYRLKRGEKNLPMSGGPDILRAVYGQEMDQNGQIENIAGDGFMMFVSWDKNGVVQSDAIHQYGSATKDSNSVHYNDQMEMFVAQQERRVLFQRAELEKQVERRYRPGLK
ncbi:penicillin acylase family protein [Glaciecola sp. 33A]|jgi:acyl-homoserine-lactone acylase|uniref:penicillin acylase family protein n=1 Tax=Glaciecola sp. 33A TaxID=2057807 RepID=UPI000C31BE29|nr:penicillin acylase family protein [Glaciecola sp. 33A]PKI02798.1 penicillin amidase [Glaciecola sp. 33A]